MPTFKGAIGQIRKEIKETAKEVNAQVEGHKNSEQSQDENRGEVMANLMLTYRHLEDASMRLGKVLQAYDGGVSVYDKETTVAV